MRHATCGNTGCLAPELGVRLAEAEGDEDVEQLRGLLLIAATRPTGRQQERGGALLLLQLLLLALKTPHTLLHLVQ